MTSVAHNILTYLIFDSKSIVIGILNDSRKIFHLDLKFHRDSWAIGQIIDFFQAYPLLIT